MPATAGTAEALARDPAELLKRLIRFPTITPPGDERECVAFVAGLLEEVGIEVRLVGRSAERPNLIARLPGEGKASPLLLQGHADVVNVAGQDWRHPPFDAVEEDGFIWGRGALDMKGGVAMMVAAVLSAKIDGPKPAGDVILAVLSDEEGGGDDGAAFLVDEHAELFADVRYALGEFGGFTQQIAGRRFYPIQVAEKQTCWMRMTIRGPGGHGSLPVKGGAMARLGEVLRRLDRRSLPLHVTPVAKEMLDAIVAPLPAPLRLAARALRDPRTSDRLLALLGGAGERLRPMLHNTASATIVRGGEKINVIPSELTVEIDGRLLPGFRPDDLIGELTELLGPGLEYEVLRYDQGPDQPDMAMFPLLRGVLEEADPGATAIPMLMPASSDARFFARLGIQTYGFLPMQLPEELNFTRLIHAADERIPAAAPAFGRDRILEVLARYGRSA